MRKISAFLAPVLAAYLSGMAVVASAYQLPDTDQRKCYQGVSPYAEMPCAGTGQDGAYVIHPMSYTDNGNGTVADNNTGLIWQREDDGNTYNGYVASGTYGPLYNPDSTNICGSIDLGGATDWRLPSRRELMSIVDYAIPYPGPTINTSHFPGTNTSLFWSWPSPVGAERPWYVDFSRGDVDWGNLALMFSVRCVRGGQSIVPILTDNGNGTVTDNRTGLVWEQGESDYMDWGSALSYCEGLDLGGSTSWRLPSIKELESLVDDTTWSPAIDPSRFPNAHAFSYWSSTTSAGYPELAWLIDFCYGNVVDKYKYKMSPVRCVRSDQPASGAIFKNLGDCVSACVQDRGVSFNKTCSELCKAGRYGSAQGQ